MLKVWIWLFLSSKLGKTEFSWKTTWISSWPCYLRNRNWSRLRKTKPWSDPVRSSNVESTGGVPSKLTGCHAVGVRPRFVVFLCLIPSDLKDLSLFWYWPSVPRVRAQSADTNSVRSSGHEAVMCIQCRSIHYGGWEEMGIFKLHNNKKIFPKQAICFLVLFWVGHFHCALWFLNVFSH